MNERLTGVLLLTLGIVFLIIYDTGKWPCLVAIIKTGTFGNCLKSVPPNTANDTFVPPASSSNSGGITQAVSSIGTITGIAGTIAL